MVEVESVELLLIVREAVATFLVCVVGSAMAMNMLVDL